MRHIIVLNNEDIERIKNGEAVEVTFSDCGRFYVMSEECFEKQKNQGLEIIEQDSN